VLSNTLLHLLVFALVNSAVQYMVVTSRTKFYPLEDNLYQREENLVLEFITSLEQASPNEWGSLKVATEFPHLSGRADILAITEDNKVLAFEAKLSKWRKALNQAYRNTSYANYSYIVVPETIAKRAALQQIEFRRHHVGICYINNGRIEIELKAPNCIPLQPWLTERAVEFIAERNKDGPIS
jgi:hypothetical protein